MATRIGIDTGGTFTDVVRIDGRRATVHKLRSTPHDPAQAVLDGLGAVRRRSGEEVDLVHGTTVGLNATLTRNLARTVFVTNRGCEDLIEVGRQERSELYALEPSRPVPPVPRRLRVGVTCRRGPGGEIVERLTKREIDAAVRAVVGKRPQAIAIGLLHAPADPADELALRTRLQRSLPDVPITCSAELVPTTGEYERFSAAILNAAIAPVVGRHTRRVEGGLGNGRLRLLRSSLGILPPDEAARFPARAMFSGPAGGVLATGQLARAAGFEYAAAFDMGGTSADVCLIEPTDTTTATGQIAGLPLPLPTVPVHTVAAGGGSIAYVDAGGSLRVGPQSAGADPGPACYGKGNEPTVTDAHVALGHIGASTLLGGALHIDVDASVRCIERLAQKLGMTTRATAEGILTVADATMARAVLVITAERCIDPAHVPLVAFGGAGGLHAGSLMRRLTMPKAIVAPHAGAFSAVGMAIAGEAVERDIPVRATAERRLVEELLENARTEAKVICERLEATRPRTSIDALVRYRGQGACLRVPLTRTLTTAFCREHQRRFGFVTDAPIEIVQVRVRCEGRPRPLPRIATEARGSVRTAPGKRRPPVGGRTLPVFSRDCAPAQPIAGPAIVEEATGTTLVPPHCHWLTTPMGLEITPIAQ